MNIDKDTLKENLIKVAARPGVYLGTVHLDCLESYYRGWNHFELGYADVDRMYFWADDFDLQEWLFTKESVSIAHAASLNGWSLFQRCYGNRNHAINQFSAAVREMPFTKRERHPDTTIAGRIFQLCNFYEGWLPLEAKARVDKKIVNLSYYPASAPILNSINATEKTYEDILPFVEAMINEPYDDLYIYLHYEHYFLQARFLFHSKARGWVDNVSLSGNEDYHRNLIMLHAFAALLQKKEHPNHIIEIHFLNGEATVGSKEVADDWLEIINGRADISVCDRNPFDASYSKWKQAVTAGINYI